MFGTFICLKTKVSNVMPGVKTDFFRYFFSSSIDARHWLKLEGNVRWPGFECSPYFVVHQVSQVALCRSTGKSTDAVTKEVFRITPPSTACAFVNLKSLRVAVFKTVCVCKPTSKEVAFWSAIHFPYTRLLLMTKLSAQISIAASGLFHVPNCLCV